ncbi:hypothetical protein ACFPRL_10365 [Pseudoclavibacter helvolus]
MGLAGRPDLGCPHRLAGGAPPQDATSRLSAGTRTPEAARPSPANLSAWPRRFPRSSPTGTRVACAAPPRSRRPNST